MKVSPWVKRPLITLTLGNHEIAPFLGTDAPSPTNWEGGLHFSAKSKSESRGANSGDAPPSHPLTSVPSLWFRSIRWEPGHAEQAKCETKRKRIIWRGGLWCQSILVRNTCWLLFHWSALQEERVPGGIAGFHDMHTPGIEPFAQKQAVSIGLVYSLCASGKQLKMV